MGMPIINVIDKGWPFAASILVAAVGYGSLSSDVHQLKIDQTVAVIDHDRVTTLVQGQADMKITLDDIEKQLDRIEKQRDH